MKFNRVKLLILLFNLLLNITIPIKAGITVYADYNIKQTIVLLINEDIYPEINSNILIFTDDLRNEGYEIFIETISERDSPSILKEKIRSYYYHSDNLVGVILIGNIKSAYTEIHTGDFSNPEAYNVWISLDACDMYYMDIDGSWDIVENIDFYEDVPDNVVELNTYDSCTTFKNENLVSLNEEKKWVTHNIENKNQYKAEIWVSRIMTHNLKIEGYNESQLINMYFKRNHVYRNLLFNVSSTSFILNAIGEGYNEQGMDYSDIFNVNIKEENMSKNQYIELLGSINGSELFYLTSHSGSRVHTFFDGAVWKDELLTLNKTSILYILNACSSCRWDQYIMSPTEPNYLGGLYAFDTSGKHLNYGLCVIGVTGVGGFNNLYFFSEYLNEKLTESRVNYGDAFKHWFNENLMINFGPHNYVILGDPTIKPSIFRSLSEPSPSPSPSLEPNLQEKYDELKIIYDSLLENYRELESDLEDSEKTIENLQYQILTLESKIASMYSQIEDLESKEVGIPGFPTLAIIIGILFSMLLFKKIHT